MTVILAPRINIQAFLIYVIAKCPIDQFFSNIFCHPCSLYCWLCDRPGWICMVCVCSPLFEECCPHTGPAWTRHWPIRGQYADLVTNQRPAMWCSLSVKDAGLPGLTLLCSKQRTQTENEFFLILKFINWNVTITLDQFVSKVSLSAWS